VSDWAIVWDPRKDEEVGSLGTNAKPLQILLHGVETPLSDSALLLNIMWRFPTNLVSVSSDAPAKVARKAWSEIEPESLIRDHVGIVALRHLTRLSLASFLDREGSWYEWTFRFLQRSQLDEITRLWQEYLSVAPTHSHPFADCTTYTIECNRDMGETTVIVYDEVLFDPMLSFVLSL
jgi:hypothetical protein